MSKGVITSIGVSIMLLVFLFGNFGTFMFYNLSETQNRKNIQELLHKNNNDLIALDISKKELHDKNTFAQNHADEIVYKGHLYDVVKKETGNDDVVFYCINDKKEESLDKELNDQVKTFFDQPSTGKTNTHTFSKNTLQDYVPVSLVEFTSLNSFAFSFGVHVTPAYDAVYHDIFSPPPAVA